MLVIGAFAAVLDMLLPTLQSTPAVPMHEVVSEQSLEPVMLNPDSSRTTISTQVETKKDEAELLLCQSQNNALQDENAQLQERVKSLERELAQIRWSSTENPPYVAFLNSADAEHLLKEEKAYIHNVLARFPVYLQTGEALALRDLALECFGPGKNCDDRIIQILGAKRLMQELSDAAKAFLMRDLREEHLVLLGLMAQEKE